MSRFLAAPREGHLEQVYHIFAYLKHHDRSSLVMNDDPVEYPDGMIHDGHWSETYPKAQEAIPFNTPEPRGIGVDMTCFVDADHAGCLATRRSHTGDRIFLNQAPILWYSKRQRHRRNFNIWFRIYCC